MIELRDELLFGPYVAEAPSDAPTERPERIHRAWRLVSELRGEVEQQPGVLAAIRRFRGYLRCGPVRVEIDPVLVDLRGQWRPLEVTPRRWRLRLDGTLGSP